MKSIITSTLFALFAISLFCCTGTIKDKVPNFDYGRVENNRYSNSFFKFNMQLPEDWVVQSQDQMEEMTRQGQELVAGDNERLKAALKATEVNTANLLSVFQYEVGEPVEYNPSLTLVAENISRAPGIKTGHDYLIHARKLLAQSQVGYDHIDEKFAKETISGADFYLMNASANYMGVEIGQVYYSTIRNGFTLCAIISFGNEEQKEMLEEILHSINFEL